MYKLILLAAFVAVALASGKPEYPEDPAANEDQVNTILGYKQTANNHRALYFGAGVGTAPYRGVPGTSYERNPAYYGHNFGHNYGYGQGYGQGYAQGYGQYGYGYNGAHGAARAYGGYPYGQHNAARDY